MLYAPNPLFIGRKVELHEIAQKIFKGTDFDERRPIVLTGMGGVGKTQLAAAFVHRFGHFFAGGVFWMDFSQRDTVPVEVAQCGGSKGLGLFLDSSELPILDRISLVQREWEKPLPRLLVFDGCEEPTLLDKWLPVTGGCHILITTKRSDWEQSRNVNLLHVDILNEKESVTFLLRLAPHLSVREAGEVSDLVGKIPLALHLAGNFLHEYRNAIRPAEYLAELQNSPLAHDSLLGRGTGHSPTKHSLNLAETFEVSWKQISSIVGNSDLPQLQVTQMLASCVANFAPREPIPLSLLKMSLQESGVKVGELDFVDALKNLLRIGFVDLEVDGITFHNLIGEFIKTKASDNKLKVSVERAVYQAAYKLNRQSPPHPFIDWYPHLFHIVDAAKNDVSITSSNLNKELGIFLNTRGEFLKARSYLQHAIDTNEDPNRYQFEFIDSLNALGEACYYAGDYESALDILTQSIQFHEESQFTTSLSYASALGNLGETKRELDEYDSALNTLQKALSICQAHLDETNPQTASILNSIGILLKEQEKYEAAYPYLKRGLEIRLLHNGREHIDTATSMVDLGSLLRAIDRLAEARTYMEEGLEIYRARLGNGHLWVAITHHNLGRLAYSSREYELAHKHFRESRLILLASVGNRHPYESFNLYHEGLAYVKEGNISLARQCFKEALSIQQEHFGDDHFDIMLTKQALSKLEQ